MKAFDQVRRFLLRFRYPVSMPEDVAFALGVEISNYITFEQFVERLTCPSCKPTKLTKYMEREKALDAFQQAHCQEHFKYSSLVSYYFMEGWLEFALKFDEKGQLRRLYLHHKSIKQDRGIEIVLRSDSNHPPLKFYPDEKLPFKKCA